MEKRNDTTTNRGDSKKSQQQGVENIDFTPNGEFFTYKQWREVLSLVQKYKMKAQLTTNAGLLNEQDIKDAVDLGISHIAVSIDSVNYDVYRIVRKPASKQAFENAIYAPILFKQYGDTRSVRGGDIYMSKCNLQSSLMRQQRQERN